VKVLLDEQSALDGQRVYLAQGPVLGGGSSINPMVNATADCNGAAGAEINQLNR